MANPKRRHGLPWRAPLLRLLTVLILVASGTAHGGESTDTPVPNTFLDTLSEQERVWLRAHPVIRVVQDPGWPPVEFADKQGEQSGMSADYLALVEQRLGVEFEQVRGLSWQEAYARLKRWEIDMTTCVAVTPERTAFWVFTHPYMRIPIVIATQLNVTYIADMHELAGKSVAIVEGYAIEDWMGRDFPDIDLVRVKAAREGLEKLQRGEVFAYIDNLLIIGYYQAEMKATSLKIAGQTPYTNAQCMAIRKDWPILAGILDKALDSISESEHDSIHRRWLPVRYEHGFDYTRLWQILALCGAIVTGLILWNRKLVREVAHRKQVETALSESERRFRTLFDVAAVAALSG